MRFIIRQLNRFRCAFSGIQSAVLKDRSFQIQALMIGPLLGLFAYLYWPLTDTELIALVFGWCLLLITELQNSSLEAALDHLHPNLHNQIGLSKDMAAGSVLLALLFLLFVLIMIIF